MAAASRQQQLAARQTEVARRKALLPELRRVTIFLSVVKAIPLVLVIYFWMTAVEPLQVPEAFAQGFERPSLVFLIAGGLLLFQMVGVFANLPAITLLPAVLMALIDAYVVIIFFLFKIGFFATVTMAFVAFTQLIIAVWAFTETFDR